MPLRPPMLRTMATAAAGGWGVVGAGLALGLFLPSAGACWGVWGFSRRQGGPRPR